MRALKTFLRKRKADMLGCGDCECRTLQCWRYANENCGCGESKLSLPNYVEVGKDPLYGEYIQFFNERLEDLQGNEILIGENIWIGDFEIIEDEDARTLWRGVWESLDGEVIAKLFGIDEGKEGVGHFTPEAMAQFNALINNPTEEQAQTLGRWLENKAVDESLIVIFDE